MKLVILLLLYICGCADEPHTNGPFTEIQMPKEIKLGEFFLKTFHDAKIEVDPRIWITDIDHFYTVCPADAGTCLSTNDIIILDDPNVPVNRCVGVLHELGHWWELTHGGIDYGHSGVLANWYKYQIGYLCSATEV